MRKHNSIIAEYETEASYNAKAINKTTMRNYILIFILALCGVIFHSFETRAQSQDSVKVFFPQSRIEIYPDYMQNEIRLDNVFHKLEADSLYVKARRLRNISVVGAASPEGTESFNKWLSEERAKAIFQLFIDHKIIPDTAASFRYLGRDWRGLLEKVNEDTDVPNRQEVLALLDRIVNRPSTVTHPLQALKSINGGAPYRYLYNKVFPSLRFSTLVVEYDDLIRTQITTTGTDSMLLIAKIPSEPIMENIYYAPVTLVEKPCRPFYMGLKTNLLYDALLIPNIGAEFYVGKNFSVFGNWMYGWWDRNRSHYYWRAYGGDIGARWWFGRKAHEKPLTGHHIGLYAGVVTYDFELGKGGIMGGLPHGTLWDRCNFNGGVEYGYSFPVARRLNIDLTIGFGYIGGKYLKYEPADGFYVWQSTNNLHWFGPSKAEVSLVWLIGCDNYNRKKGGD